MSFDALIGQRIRAIREQMNLSLDDVAQKFDTSPSTISAIELGNRKVKAEDLVKFSRILGISVNYLLGYDTPPPEQEPMDRVLLRSTTYLHPNMKEQVASFARYVQSLELLPASHSLTADTPTELLERLGWTERPVDVRVIAALAGIHVVSWPFDDDICAVLVITEGRKAIGVNRSHPRTRQRFSIAHELGHYFLGHTNDVNVSLKDQFLSDAQSNPFQERQANEFGARLLMPAKWVREDFESLGGSLSRLAELYQVSEQAMWIRLTETGVIADNLVAG